LQRRPLGGVGRATAHVLPLIAEQVDVELLTARDLPPADVGLPEHPLATPWPGVATGWLQWSAPQWLGRFDGIFHCPWYALPFRQPVPMVTTLHDLTFEHHPGWFGRAQRRSYVTQARWAARTARAVITVSRFVADDIMATYGVPADRMFIASHAVDAVFRPERDATAVCARLGIRRPYVAALGGGARRRLDAALDAWRAVRDEHGIDLVVVGTDQLPHEPGVHGGRLGDEDWADVLAGARALVYPTAYEGFGLPALEAAASGTPVICARVGALPEVLGDSAVWCEDLSARTFAAQLRRLLTDDPFAEQVRTAGIQRAAGRRSWQPSADEHLAAYSLAAS
jgi:glycosyltransferase involved in cell wall biosynthesis